MAAEVEEVAEGEEVAVAEVAEDRHPAGEEGDLPEGTAG